MNTIIALRWSSRIISALLILFFVYMFIGETFYSPDIHPKEFSAVDIAKLSLLGVCLLGLALAWKWEMAGAVITLVTYGISAIITPRILAAPILFILPTLALLYILVALRSKKSSDQNTSLS